jgi:hypothetical protein
MATKKKETRCWPGYEPVKGKKPHSEGSCRPKAESKVSGSEKAFRAKRRRQLDECRKITRIRASRRPSTSALPMQPKEGPAAQVKCSILEKA